MFTSVCVNTVESTLDVAERPPGLAQHTSSPPAEEAELLIDKYSIQADGAISKAQAALLHTSVSGFGSFGWVQTKMGAGVKGARCLNVRCEERLLGSLDLYQ